VNVANIYFPLGLIEKADIFSFEKIKSEEKTNLCKEKSRRKFCGI
jgi:hypothetical protein